MCDTMVSTPVSSADKAMIVGKNSDREPNEAQNITFIPAMDHPGGARVQCTYITIPQVKHTCAALLSRPFWMYGAEMGVNEYGVAIGNEAVFTKEKYHKKNDALLGMDMLRLALERSRNAKGAIDVIIDLLDRYGQGGVHTMGGTKYYHNSFIVADPMEAYVFESAGTQWVYKKVTDVASISNCLTIESDFDRTSYNVGAGHNNRNVTNHGQLFNFKEIFSDRLYTYFARGKVRKSCSFDMLASKKGSITSSDMMKVLRSHNMIEPYQPGKRPMQGICLHAGGLISSQTVGSMVAVLKKGRPPLVYFTGTSAPCMGIFKPHTIEKNQKKMHFGCQSRPSPFGGFDIYGSASSSFDESTLWWTGEVIHRHVLMNYSSLMPLIQSRRNEIESRIISSVEKKWNTSSSKDFSKICNGYAEELLKLNNDISEIIKKESPIYANKKEVSRWFATQWNSINSKAGFIFSERE
ncbi:MAG: C69 family dipeptidase [Spirochaetes bacterium]|nr:C69 family dipeptidase [Spirochaetota bacterium]